MTTHATNSDSQLQALQRQHVPGYVPPRFGWITQLGLALTAGLGAQYVLLLLNLAGQA